MKLVVLDGYTENPGDLSWNALKEFGDLTVYDRTSFTESPLITERIGDAEIIITNKTPISRETIDKCPRIKLIAALATGYNVIDYNYAAEKGIPVVNVPTYGTASVSQFSIALLLEICHHIGHHDKTVHEGKWAENIDWCYWDYPLIELAGKTVAVSGSGNVAIYATEKAQQLGAKVVTVSDSTGWVYDPEGIDLAALKEIKEVKRARLTEYKNYRPNAEYHEGRGVWSVKVDIALPCATQNELHLEDAKALVANGCIAVAEGANMPTTMEATEYLQENGVLFAPGKAANAGGVATSALEMSQNSERLSWTFEEVDGKLQQIMVNICHNMADAAEKYGAKGNYVVGANIAGFEKVVEAMTAQGIV